MFTAKMSEYPKHIIPCYFSDNGKVILLENSRKRIEETFLNNFDSCSAVLALLSTDATGWNGI